MIMVLNIVLIVVCVLLVLLVLLQQGKGAGAGLVIGGGMSQTMFGGSGGRDFFIKLTAGLATAFLVLCLVIARMSSKAGQQYEGILSDQGQQAPASAPAQMPAAPAGQPAAPVQPSK